VKLRNELHFQEEVRTNKNCSCCGHPEHGMLREITDENGLTKLEYNCPVSLYINWESCLILRRRAEKYWISPHKFAEYYGYNIDEVNSAFDIYRTCGYGRWNTKEDNDELKEGIINICLETRSTWTFKR